MDNSKNIFDMRETDIGVLGRRLKNYIQAAILSDDDQVMINFLIQHSFKFTEPVDSSYDWQAKQPKKGKPVPPMPVTILFDRETSDYEKPYYKLQLICGEYSAAEHFLGTGAITTTVENVQYVPAEPFYGASTLKMWDEYFLSRDATPPSEYSGKQIEGIKAELKVRLEFGQTLEKPKYTKDAGPDMKPCFIELLAPVGKNKNAPKMMITSRMTGSILFFRPHPDTKNDGSLLLCHLTPGSTKHKDFEERCSMLCSFGGKNVSSFDNQGMFGPAEYGGGFFMEWEGDEPQGSPTVDGTCIVVGIWSETRQQWRLFAQIFTVDDDMVGAVEIFGPRGMYPLRQDYLNDFVGAGGRKKPQQKLQAPKLPGQQ